MDVLQYVHMQKDISTLRVEDTILPSNISIWLPSLFFSENTTHLNIFRILILILAKRWSQATGCM
jgi:hypothetical protein